MTVPAFLNRHHEMITFNIWAILRQNTKLSAKRSPHGYADCEFPIHFQKSTVHTFFIFAPQYTVKFKYSSIRYLVFDFDTETTHCNAHSHGMKTE
jgi:hypothetical protein